MRDLLSKLWHGWKIIARRIGYFQTRLILSLIYFVIVGPVALILRLLSDPLAIGKKDLRTRWQARLYPTLSLKQASRQ